MENDASQCTSDYRSEALPFAPSVVRDTGRTCEQYRPYNHFGPGYALGQMHREARMSVSRIYPHRRNKDGSYDSICLTCFLTVSHAYTEAELTEQEMAHVCHVALRSKRADSEQKQLARPDLKQTNRKGRSRSPALLYTVPVRPPNRA